MPSSFRRAVTRAKLPATHGNQLAVFRGSVQPVPGFQANGRKRAHRQGGRATEDQEAGRPMQTKRELIAGANPSVGSGSTGTISAVLDFRQVLPQSLQDLVVFAGGELVGEFIERKVDNIVVVQLFGRQFLAETKPDAM